MKYQQRDSWSHGDLLRLAHPKTPSAEREAVFRWILAGVEGLGERAVKRRTVAQASTPASGPGVSPGREGAADGGGLDAARGRAGNQQAGRLHYTDRVATYAPAGKLPEIIEAFEKAKMASTKGEIVRLINDFDLPREAVPTQWLNELEVWDALLQRMPLTALVRNLGKMSAIGLVKPFSQAADLVVRKLKDEAGRARTLEMQSVECKV